MDAACKKRPSVGHDMDVIRQPKRMPAAWSQNCGKVVFVRGLVPGEAQVVIDAEDGIFGRQIAQRLDGVEAEDQTLDEPFKDRLSLVVFGAVRLKPFVVIILAKPAQKIEDWLELGHEIDLSSIL